MEDPSLARKRRILRRAKSRSYDEEAGEDVPSSKRLCVDDDYTTEDDESGCTTQRTVPSIRGIKKQARYEPGVPMTKEELTAWRKEARRVRNRESAAASRQRTRSRIAELEAQLEEMKAKYSAAVKRISELEQGAQVSNRASGGPWQSVSPESAAMAMAVGGLMAPKSVISPTSSVAGSPEMGPSDLPCDEPFALPLQEEQMNLSVEPAYLQDVPKYHHQPIMPSRPTAVCV